MMREEMGVRSERAQTRLCGRGRPRSEVGADIPPQARQALSCTRADSWEAPIFRAAALGLPRRSGFPLSRE